MRFIEVKVRDENFYDALGAMLKAIGHEMTEDEIMDKMKLLSLADITDLFDAIEDNDSSGVKYYMGIEDTNEYGSPSRAMGDRDFGQNANAYAGRQSRDRLDKGRHIPQKKTVAGGRKMPTGGAYNDADQAVEPGSAIDRPD